MAITAKQVQELRNATGAGMMDAKRALTEADGDFEAATQVLREKGLAKAAKRTDRDNSEGLVGVVSDSTGGALVQLKSETDFVAKSADFVSMVQDLAQLVLGKGPEAVTELDGPLEDLKLKAKENIEIGKVVRYEQTDGAVIDTYLHGGGTAAVLIEAEGTSQEALHEIAMHIAFAKPRYLTREDVPADEAEKEKASLLEITKKEGKPEAALEKIVEGRLNSWYGEIVLLEQGVFGEKETVETRLGEGATIKRFELVVVGT